MPFATLAQALLLVHGAFVLFVVAGGVLVLRWPRLAWAHVPAAVWGALIEFTGFICPLTPLENAWRRAAGEQGYQGGFIEHYVTAALYPSGLTRPIQIALGLLVLGVNGWIYWRLWRRRARPRQVTDR
jgi:Protein of Unknown function (DUF2784)